MDIFLLLHLKNCTRRVKHKKISLVVQKSAKPLGYQF
jgi:hypothetical protein